MFHEKVGAVPTFILSNAMRRPAVAGTFYPDSERELNAQIESMIDKNAKKQKAIGIVSPHAGYIYSGPVCADLFSKIEIPERVIILGPNHTGLGSTFSLYKSESWAFPFGEVQIDEELASDIATRTSLIKEDESAHMLEHSLEVQVPFLHYFKRGCRIVPIIVSDAGYNQYIEVADAIADAIKDSNEDILIVASSDMTHYESQEDAKQKDEIALDAILKLDPRLLIDNVKKHMISMCGYIPTVIMIMASKALGATSAKLAKYQTSGDTSGDYSSVVGYAGVIVE